MESRFLWGVAISAYQTEGGYNRPGEPQTNWAQAEQARTVAPLGSAAAFWRHYRDDLARCRAMGLNAFRLSIEWSRVQPSFHLDDTREPAFDEDAITAYARLIEACHEHGLEPIVTLHHFIHPLWLGVDAWLSPRTPPLFEAFIEKILIDINGYLMRRGNPPIRYLITINEPNMLVMSTYLTAQFPSSADRGLRPALTAMNRLLETHVRLYNLIHDLYDTRHWGPVRVTFNNYVSDIYWLDKAYLDLMTLRERGLPPDAWLASLRDGAARFNAELEACTWLNPGPASAVCGKVMRRLSHLMAGWMLREDALRPIFEALLASPRPQLLDYVALDYYDPFSAHGLRLPSPGELAAILGDHPRENLLRHVSSRWWDWKVLPTGLRFFCECYARDYAPKALLIAENGMAHPREHDNRIGHRRDGIRRSAFLELHTREVIQMALRGIPLLGYLHWSLVDNYEWGTFTPRFGLFSIDYQRGTQRLSHDHYGDCPSETYARIIRNAF